MSSTSEVYSIPKVHPFEFETSGDYIFVDKWFEYLEKSTSDWLKHIGTKRSFSRIEALTKKPAVKLIEISQSEDTNKISDTESLTDDSMPELCHSGDEKGELSVSEPDEENEEQETRGDMSGSVVGTLKDESIKRLAVHKYAVAIVLMYLGNTVLSKLVEEKCPSNVLVSKRCESLHIKSTDAWFNVSHLAKYLGVDVNKFITTELEKYSDRFGTVAHSEPVVAGGDERVIWFHPMLLLPFMIWSDPMAATEIMGSYFSAEGIYMPNTDIFKALMLRNKKNNPPEPKSAPASKPAKSD